jgi:outer membrane protein insertion porin family
MISRGPAGLSVVSVCLLCLSGISALAQTTPSQPAQTVPAQPKKPSPFESVPRTEPAKPAQPAPPAPQPQPQPGQPQVAAPAAPVAVESVVETVEFRGNRRVLQDTLRALVFTKKGDKYDEEGLRRDFMALWNTGRFDDLRLETEPGTGGIVVRFVVTERRVVRTIKYEGIKSVTVSEILDRFKERKVGLTVESQYEDAKVQRARTVLQEFLSERGRQYAVVIPELRQIPPSSIELVFQVTEGPKVKVGDISFTGNTVFSGRVVRRAMKNLRPIGVPYSILLENMFSKAYDINKLEEDKERIRIFYQEHGYFTARALEHKSEVRDVGGGKFRFPLFYMNKPGKRADIQIAVEEGKLYRLNKVNFVGVKLFKTPEVLMAPLFQMKPGDVFSTAKLKKGMENMRKYYGEFGYIDFVPEPSPEPLPNSDKIDLTLAVDEGKQFFVRRIDFSGNTTTRDKVIRRELYIDEGQMFNTRMWELSILRLNQLGYFEVLKENEAADIKRDTRTNTVDITLKVKERGKNTIGLQGGVSGIAGSFIGFNYATNNFLGLGETLSLDSQIGDRIRNVTLGFTEPYFLDKPMQVGATVYMQRYNFDYGREVSLMSGRNLIPLYESLGKDNLLNYVQNGHGFTTFASYPLRRSFARVGLTYGFDISNIKTMSTAAQQYFSYTSFQTLGGPNSLSGIRTSRVIPSYTYNTIDHPITPSRGKSIFFSMSFAGSVLGGNVNMIEPTFEFKTFRPALKKGHVLGFRFLGRHLTGFGGKMAPPYNRFYMGGENDVRGFEIWTVSPIAFVASEGSATVLNADGSPRLQKTIVDGVATWAPVTQRIPVYQLISAGGDTQGVANLEYRIPIAGPVTLAAFYDAGLNKVVNTKQLSMNAQRVAELNGLYPQAGFDGKAYIAPGTQHMRMSTGLELQVLMPVVNAPFRIYWAYNPMIVRTFLQTPIVADRSLFPNNMTFLNSVATWGAAYPFYEKRKTFRFTIGRTF